MKKLSIIFVLLFALLVTTGCQKNKQTVRFNEEEETSKTTVTSLDDEKKVRKPLSATSSVEEKTSKPTTPTINFAITTPNNQKIDTKTGYHVIKGTAPRNTHRIKINNYTLKRYYPGQTSWSYIASTGIGTLKNGENKYISTALDKNGKEIGSKEITINYEAPVITSLPSVGTSELIILLFSLVASLGYFGLKRRFQ